MQVVGAGSQPVCQALCWQSGCHRFYSGVVLCQRRRDRGISRDAVGFFVLVGGLFVIALPTGFGSMIAGGAGRQDLFVLSNFSFLSEPGLGGRRSADGGQAVGKTFVWNAITWLLGDFLYCVDGAGFFNKANFLGLFALLNEFVNFEEKYDHFEGVSGHEQTNGVGHEDCTVEGFDQGFDQEGEHDQAENDEE